MTELCGAVTSLLVLLLLIYGLKETSVLLTISSYTQNLPYIHKTIIFISKSISYICGVIPLYHIYLYYVGFFNVLYHMMVQMMYRKGMPDRTMGSVAGLFIGSFVVPTVINFIIVNEMIVVMLLIPFHLAGTISYMGYQGYDQYQPASQGQPVRNFVIFVLVAPVVYRIFSNFIDFLF